MSVRLARYPWQRGTDRHAARERDARTIVDRDGKSKTQRV
jgi:hypothetical protein